MNNEIVPENSINKNNKKDSHKCGKYNKEKDSFSKSIQHIQIKDKNFIRKFSFSTYNKNVNTAYYYCSDTSCLA